ncbi:MAG TPA: 3-keto-5-aminohexanoate cleavage protein [Thermodesulfobacteriota bacterium]|nr:3-keto-5-aminohexanoate cleavage protein [Thermodesulfobacteriota bacterium]
MRVLRTTPKLIVTVAPTGPYHGKEANANLPMQPDEIAQAAYDCWNEGASVVHIHAKDKDGKNTRDPEVFMEIDRRIREKKCDIIIQHSSALDFTPKLAEDGKITAIETDPLPEMASLGLFLTRLADFKGQEIISIARWSDLEWGAREMLKKGVKPELEVFNIVLMEDVYRLIDMGLLAKPYLINIIMGMRRINRAYMSYSPKMMMHMVDMLPPDSIFTTMGIAADELPATTQSILLGGHVRVGFEDNIIYRKGDLAESNAQLVARTVRIGRELGCEIATPAEARQMLNIPQLGKL